MDSIDDYESDHKLWEKAKKNPVVPLGKVN